MKSLILNNNNSNSIIVSNLFLDNFMPNANGEFVKIYLYLIRCISDPSMQISISLLADKFNHTENDVIRALRYWEKSGLISLLYDTSKKELVSITLLSSDDTNYMKELSDKNSNNKNSNIDNTADINSTSNNSNTTNHTARQDVPNIDVPIIIESIAERKPKPSYTSSQLKQFCEKDDLSQLLYIAQKYLGKTLTSTETNSIIYFYEALKFPSDLIEYLIEYCVSKEHKSMRYIEKVAISWADAGIESISQAKKEITFHNNNIYSVMKAFGISNRNLGIREQEFISKWNDVYCFDSEIIIEACNRTIQVTHQPSFEYADSILSKWKEKNITRLSELKSLDEQYVQSKNTKERILTQKTTGSSNSSSNKFNNFTQRDYNFDELEKQLIGNNS
ncbi:DnaD domain-containing protein [[Clostridium] fimetarium]|uniref:DnaD and phage-associated domain-containing protein n=1 Tax=[Clostridium] fimetarium TaxID=99656 RepID=A0A1I0M1B9_9FIRM|nr:DnaD domain protein [[Clostridium] fimetarium]SEV82072.1 DnaD and phage-associated domain-containing protein [[Clostridium] fimetarium]